MLTIQRASVQRYGGVQLLKVEKPEAQVCSSQQHIIKQIVGHRLSFLGRTEMGGRRSYDTYHGI